MISKIIITEIYPKVAKGMGDAKVRKDIINFCMAYFDYNNASLFTSIPQGRVILRDVDKDLFYKSLDISREDIQESIKRITFIDANWKTLNNEFNFLILCILIYFHRNKMVQEAKMVNMFIFVFFYGMLSMRLFPYIQPNVMEYTINHLNDKHDLKKYGTIFKTIEKKAEVSFETYSDNLLQDDDKMIVQYIIDTQTRVNQWLKGILDLYVENKKLGKYFQKETDTYDDDDFNEITNNYQEVSKITGTVMQKIFTNPVNQQLLHIAATITDIGYGALVVTIEDVRKKGDTETVKQIIENLLVVFLIDNKKTVNDIKSKGYVNDMLLIYNNSNTVNESILIIKRELDKLLVSHSQKYLQTNREATKINWRKSIFLYYALCVQYFA